VLACVGLLSSSSSAGMSGVIWAGGLGLFLTVLQLPERSVDRLKTGFFLVATFHAVLLLTQILAPGFWSELELGFVPSRSSALVGNREFFATLLGLGILLRFPN